MTRAFRHIRQTARLLAGALVLALPAACATAPATAPEGPAAAYVGQGEGLAGRFAPVFVPQRPGATHNRIGTPVVTGEDPEDVAIDPERPAIFFREIPFTTERGAYTNLVYRVHFTRTPYRFRPANVSAGRNVGLLVVVTVNQAGQPVLVTTVHTCGCYLAFLPTPALPADAYPADWPEEGRQSVWGEHLPARLDPPPDPGGWRPVLWFRDGTHRIRDAALMTGAEINVAFAPVPTPLRPMADLDALAVPGGGATSLFETDGRRKGYVKGSYKPLEMVFVSWWAWDLYVGSDKRYGPREGMNTVFYTSLAPWNRTESDMWPFADFLRFWGWRL